MFEDPVPYGIFENLKGLSGCCNTRRGRRLKLVTLAGVDHTWSCRLFH